MHVVTSQMIVGAHDYARTSKWFTGVGDIRRANLVDAVTKAFDDDVYKNTFVGVSSKPTGKRVEEIKKRVRKELTDKEPKGFLPIIFAAVLGFLVTKLLDYLWDNYVNSVDQITKNVKSETTSD
jgi:preprotein translocase subunit SecA